MISVTSHAFKNNQSIPDKYTCDGDNINPPLKIEGVPPLSTSLVLIVDDPDSPSGTFTHWLVWNINPNIKEVKENSLPTRGEEGTTSSGRIEYTSPCPPEGSTHRYFFKIYALDTILDLLPVAAAEDLGPAMEDHILDEGILIGTYSR
jgi:hypothetical protein